MSASLIASGMIDRNSNVSRLIEKLRETGLLNREEDVENRRMVKVTISEKGIDVLTKIVGLRPGMRVLFAQMTDTEAETFNLLLDKLRSTQSSLKESVRRRFR